MPTNFKRPGLNLFPKSVLARAMLVWLMCVALNGHSLNPISFRPIKLICWAAVLHSVHFLSYFPSSAVQVKTKQDNGLVGA